MTLGGCRWISCRKNMGYHATDPRIRTQGAKRERSWIAMKHGDGSLECRTQNALQKGRPSFTQVQGPRGEVKPYFLPSCIAMRHLARSTRPWLQSSSRPEVEEPVCPTSSLKKMKIRSPLRGGLSLLLSPRSSFPLSSWGRGCHTRPRREDSCRLHSSVDLVFVG
jgi:hypothetical protein